MSGRPLSKKSTDIISFLSQKSNKSFPIIGVGGVHSPQDAIEKLEAGDGPLFCFDKFNPTKLCKKCVNYSTDYNI